MDVPVRNPFALRECLEVALEVTWPDMGEDHAASLRQLARSLPAQVGAARVALSPGEQEALLACASHFRLSRTFYWLRTDLSDALGDLEQQLKR